MNREALRDLFPESAAREWRWIEHTLSDLATSIGLSTESQRDNNESSQSRDEIVHTLFELQRRLQALFAEEKKWWSEIDATPTSCERHQASLNKMADKRRTLLREVHGLLETAKFVASVFEWEELASSVQYFRTRLAEYRALENQAASSLTSASPKKGTPAAKTPTARQVQDRLCTHGDEALHFDAVKHADEPRRRPKPR